LANNYEACSCSWNSCTRWSYRADYSWAPDNWCGSRQFHRSTYSAWRTRISPRDNPRYYCISCENRNDLLQTHHNDSNCNRSSPSWSRIPAPPRSRRNDHVARGKRIPNPDTHTRYGSRHDAKREKTSVTLFYLHHSCISFMCTPKPS